MDFIDGCHLSKEVKEALADKEAPISVNIDELL
jgi:hypothetical protein